MLFRSIAVSPQVLLMDEPFASLDPETAGRMVALTFVDTCGAAPMAPVTPRQAAIDAAGIGHRGLRLVLRLRLILRLRTMLAFAMLTRRLLVTLAVLARLLLLLALEGLLAVVAHEGLLLRHEPSTDREAFDLV